MNNYYLLISICVFIQLIRGNKYVPLWKLPTSMQLRYNLPRVQGTVRECIKDELKNKKICLCVDETTDAQKHSVILVVARPLKRGGPPASLLLSSKRIQKTNAETVVKIIKDLLREFCITGTQVTMFVTDGAATMLRVGRMLKICFPTLLHITCLIHACHLVAATIRKKYMMVDKLIASTKKVFIKPPKHIRVFQQLCPKLPPPPQPVITRWGTWLQAVSYYQKYFSQVKNVILKLDSNDSAAVRDSQQLFSNLDVQQQIDEISMNYSEVAQATEQLENGHLSARDVLHCINHLQATLESLTNTIRVDVAQKFGAILTKNPDLQKVRSITENQECPDEEKQYLTSANLTSLDVERSFSKYTTTMEALLMLQFYAAYQGGCQLPQWTLRRQEKLENRRKDFLQTKLKVISDGNITRVIMSRRRNDLDLRNSTTLIYSNWSPWSRCEDCLQTRMKKCISPKCRNTRYLEEKLCAKKRCIRKNNLLKSSKKELHVVRKIRDNSLLTRTMRSREWTKWTEWTPCSRKCRTQRHRVCKKPGRCKKQKQVQSAYCYHEKTQCENYVLSLLDNNKSIDLSKYAYLTGKQPSKIFPSKKKCGRPLKKSRMLKIIGGVESKKQKWPWHVAVLNKYLETFCSGTLIAPRWVLTAGHCLRSYLRVRFNEHDLTTHDGREVDMTVQRMFLHPQFNHFTVDNDIALLRLPRPVRLPVACLPSIEPVDRELCFIMGWGKQKSEDIYGTNKLHEALIPVVNTTVCKKAYRNYIITNNMFCAGWKSGFADTCAGDSGGGLMCPLKKAQRSTPYAIQGITSFGDGCGRKNKYGIYTKVYNYLQWIENTIESYS